MEASGHVGCGGKVFILHVVHMEHRGQKCATVISNDRERGTSMHCLGPDVGKPNNNEVKCHLNNITISATRIFPAVRQQQPANMLTNLF
jgi:hypothetical protein